MDLPVQQTVISSVPPTTPDRPNSFLGIALLAAIIASSMAFFLFWQNQLLRNRLANLQVIASPVPVASTTVFASPDPTADWKEFSNKTFSIKVPPKYNFDQRYLENPHPTDMNFEWSNATNQTPTQAISISIHFLKKDATNFVKCNTNEDCFNYLLPSFKAGYQNNYREVTNKIGDQNLKGIETWSTTPSNTANLLYQYSYPISHDGKLFEINIQINTPTKEMEQSLLPEIGQILSTFKFSETAVPNNWQTYTNSNAGISFEYPPEWKTEPYLVSGGTVTGVVQLKKTGTTYDPEPAAITIEYRSNPQNLSLQAFQNTLDIGGGMRYIIYDPSKQPVTDYTIGSEKGYLANNANCEPFNCAKYAVSVNGKIYEIKVFPKSISTEKTVIAQILSTFKFIE